MNHISIMFVCASVITSSLNSCWCHHGHVRSLTRLPCRLLPSLPRWSQSAGILCRQRDCDLWGSLASLQAVCYSFIGPLNGKTQMRTTLMQHDPACSLHTELWVILHLRAERNIPLMRYFVWCSAWISSTIDANKNSMKHDFTNTFRCFPRLSHSRSSSIR